MRRSFRRRSGVALAAMLLALTSASAAYAATTTSKLDDAIKDVEKVADQQRVESVGETPDLRNTATYLEQVKAALARKDLATARDVAQNASRMTRTPEFQTAWTQLVAQLNKEIDTARAAFPETVKAAFERARTKCMEAKSEDDLEGVDDELQALSTQAGRMPPANDSAPDRSLPVRLQDGVRAIHLCRDMLAAEASGNTAQALNCLTNLENIQSRFFTSAALAKVRESIFESANAATDRRITALAEAVAKAANLEDCQKALDKFNVPIRNNMMYNTGGYNGGNESNRLTRAAQTVQAWISVSSAKAAGHPRRALTLLNQQPTFNAVLAERSAFDYTVIPEKSWDKLRTEVTQMVAEEAKVIREPELKEFVDAVDKAKTLEALVEAIKLNPVDFNRQFNGYVQPYTFDNLSVVAEIGALNTDVNTLAAMRDDLDNSRFRNIVMSWGSATPATSSTGNLQYSSFGTIISHTGAHRWKNRIQAIKQDILQQALVRYSQIPDLKAGPDEAPDQMLLRVADEAFKVHDYRKVLRALDAYRTTFYGVGPAPDWLASDMRGCAAYLAGANCESADIPVASIRSYLAVLAETGSRVPSKEAGERLKVLRLKFPDAVNAAAALPSTPPSTPTSAPAQAAAPSPVSAGGGGPTPEPALPAGMGTSPASVTPPASGPATQP